MFLTTLELGSFANAGSGSPDFVTVFTPGAKGQPCVLPLTLSSSFQ